MLFKALIGVTAIVVAVNAQGTGTASASMSGSIIPSGVPGTITPCIEACIGPAAAQNGCGSFTNVTCVCTSAQFQADAGACLQQHCTTAELQIALQLQNAECGGTSPTATGTPTPNSVSFTLSGSTSAPTSATSGSTPASGSTGTTPSVTPSTGSTSASASASSPTTSSAATSSFVTNGGLGAIIAMIAGFLAI